MSRSYVFALICVACMAKVLSALKVLKVLLDRLQDAYPRVFTLDPEGPEQDCRILLGEMNSNMPCHIGWQPETQT